MMKKLYQQTNISCKEATLLIQKREEGRLGLWERFRLWYHIIFCKACKLFQQQSRLLNASFSKWNQQLEHRLPFQLSKDSAERIAQRLKKEAEK